MKNQKPQLGFGLGLRPEHYEALLSDDHAIDWLEIITENYLIPGGKPHFYLEQICERYPLVMHGVSMSLGSTDPLDFEYLKSLKALANRIQPKWVSDHLCWTGIQHKNTHDLLPMPYTDEAIKHIVQRIKHVQDYLEQPILIENVSSYVNFKQSTLKEWEFISRIAEEANCHILLDINNIYVSAINHEFNPLDYLFSLPADRIYQIHLAGHNNQGNHIIDTHDHAIADPVWTLYEEAIGFFGPVSTMIERDDDIPPISTLIEELERAKMIVKNFSMSMSA